MTRVKDLRRNKKHRNIAIKHGLDRRIVFETFDHQVANQIEIHLIAELKTHVDHGFGANFTHGGDGVIGHAQESIDLIKASWDDEKRQRYSKRMKEKNPMHDLAVVNKVASSLRQTLTGVKKSPEHRENIRLSKLGDKNPMKGCVGSKSPFALSIQVCERIRQMLDENLTQREISEETGVSTGTIKAIKSGKHWSCS